MPSTAGNVWVNDANAALFTDLYELTMLQVYFNEGMHEDAVFSLFVRGLPAERNYLLACGLDSALHYLETFRFGEGELSYLTSLGNFSDTFIDWLREFRFTGSVFAVPEGTPVFAGEPILEIVAPISEAQIVETFVMNQVHLQTVLATKAARVVAAADGRTIVDFAARRMQGTDAALKGARAFYIAGAGATSNVLAGCRYGIPVSGTMAHSFIQAGESELDAFRAFTSTYPGTVLLVDTYDTLAGIRKVVQLAEELGNDFKVSAVRLDSGDLVALAREARRILDDNGLNDVRIFASGGLDEYKIAALLTDEAPIDGFGVGTAMGVAADAPALDIAYKLVAYAGQGRLKLSTAKRTLPGRKQVFRHMSDGKASGDTIARSDEKLDGTPLLRCVMRDGRLTDDARPTLAATKRYAERAIATLPAGLRGIEPAPDPYPVRVSDALRRYEEEVAAEVTAEPGG